MYRARNHRAIRDRAFTLIELLVVIAIIAILAAILFPVFAQAKLAAKGAASLSNTKQMSLGVIMYSGDADDMFPLGIEYNDPSGVFYFGGGPTGKIYFSPWSYTVLPYIKSANIYVDPLAGGNNGWDGGVPLSVWLSYNPHYGYNYTLLNGGIKNAAEDPDLGDVYGTVSATSISRPADMVALTTTTQHTDPGYGIGAYGWFLTLGQIEGPWCDYTTTSCSDLSSYWGTDNGWAGVGHPYDHAAYVEGSDTSGVALRAPSERAEVAFVDGHSKAMSPGELARGTDWAPAKTKSQVHLVDGYKDTFRWYQY